MEEAVSEGLFLVSAAPAHGFLWAISHVFHLGAEMDRPARERRPDPAKDEGILAAARELFLEKATASASTTSPSALAL